MAINDARFPSVEVLANGSIVDGVVDVEVSSNSYMGADRYRLTLSLTAGGYAPWASNTIDLSIAFELAGNRQTLILGPMDRIEVDVGSGLIHVDGRDLTARFIEARTQETFENSTSSEIVTLLAVRRGLLPNVVPTSTLTGRNFGGGHAGTTLDQFSTATTEWDLLAKLADLEGFDVWVDGETLNFAPPVADPSPVTITPQDCTTMKLERTPSLCGAVQVAVKSWDCRGNRAVSQLVGATESDSFQRSYVLIRPNLTDTSAASLAQRTLSQMTQNARVIAVDMPGEIALHPRQTVQLTNTNTDFDGVYVITSVERRLSHANGFVQTVQARTPPWTIF